MVASFLTGIPPGLSPKGLWLLQEAPGFWGTYFMDAFFLVGLLETPFLFLPYILGGPLCALGEAALRHLGKQVRRRPQKKIKRNILEVRKVAIQFSNFIMVSLPSSSFCCLKYLSFVLFESSILSFCFKFGWHSLWQSLSSPKSGLRLGAPSEFSHPSTFPQSST